MIAIKDTEMPKHCMTCQYYDPLYDRCHIGHFDTGAKYIKGDDKWYFKHPNCPLVEIITCENCNNHGLGREHHPDIDGARYCPTLHTYTGYDYYCGDAERR